MIFTGSRHIINWRLITIHLVATFFFMSAARHFAILSNMGIVGIVDKYGLENGLKHLVREDSYPTQLSYLILSINLSALIGLLLASAISLVVTFKRKVSWLNALIVFIAAILLNRFGLFDNKIVDTIFFPLSFLGSQLSLEYKFLATGTILTLAGLVVFFSKWTNSFAFVGNITNKEL